MYRTPFEVLLAVLQQRDLVALAQYAGLLDAMPADDAPSIGFSSVAGNPPFVTGDVAGGDTNGQIGISGAA